MGQHPQAGGMPLIVHVLTLLAFVGDVAGGIAADDTAVHTHRLLVPLPGLGQAHQMPVFDEAGEDGQLVVPERLGQRSFLGDLQHGFQAVEPRPLVELELELHPVAAVRVTSCL